jgi:Transposase DDE domain group 1
VLDFLDEQENLEYTVNTASNKILKRRVRAAMRRARRMSKESGKTEHVYGELLYKTKKTWKHERRVIYKAEVTRHPERDPKDNPRFVVTNMKQSPKRIYEKVYCDRGDIENRIKELHEGMEIDRTSCHSFWANQFRVLMTAAAYVLMQELRLRLARTDHARTQVWIFRERFLKLGAQVISSVRRIVLHLPQSFPYRENFQRLAVSLCAQT